MIDYVALKAELLNNPNAYTSGAHTLTEWFTLGSDNDCANILNLARPEIIVKNQVILSADVLEAIDSRDLIASPNLAHCSWFEAAMNQGSVRLLAADGVTNTRALGNIKRLIGDTNGSTTRINAVANKSGSRAEQLFGVGTVLSSGDITIARSS